MHTDVFVPMAKRYHRSNISAGDIALGVSITIDE